MIKLSVNVNKIATLRNARGGTRPSVTEFARLSIDAGAHGITVHPRPDERHIRRSDVFELREMISDVEFNIEGYPDERYLKIIEEARPDQATLVPDPPDALTSNAGWDCVRHAEFLKETVARLKDLGVRVSIFLEDDADQVQAAAETGTDRIELYTEPFAAAFAESEEAGRKSFESFARAAEEAGRAGLGINAGHDLNQANMKLMRELPGLLEVSIGHALVVEALREGWVPTIQNYLKVLNGGPE